MNKSLAFVIHHVDFIENLGIPYLSTVAKQQGWNVELIVFDPETIDGEMERVKPAVVGYSVMSSDVFVFLDINRYLKSKFDFISIMGGPHPTFFPDVRFEEGIDYICRGEGEIAFGNFLTQLEEGRGVEDVMNIGSAEFLNPLGALVADLDTLPFPDRDLTFQKTNLGSSRLKAFSQSRGCPFSCTYCFNNPLNEMQRGLGKRFRAFSPERVVKEINDVRSRYPLTVVKFQDDLFAPKTEWLEKFCQVYKREVGLPFYALDRLDLVTEERLEILKEANCQSLGFAIDSASLRIRKQILGRSMKLTNDEIIDRLRMVKEAGIHSLTAFIHGIPTSTVQDELDATMINSRGKVSVGLSTILVPYPGTAIYDYCVENDLLDEHIVAKDGKEAIARLKDHKPFNSIQKRSILTCFDDEEKDTLFNISNLFLTMCTFPRLRGILYFLARRIPPNPLFVLWTVLLKGYKMDKYIYPMKEPFHKKLKIFFKALKIESDRMWGKVKDISAESAKIQADPRGAAQDHAGEDGPGGDPVFAEDRQAQKRELSLSSAGSNP